MRKAVNSGIYKKKMLFIISGMIGIVMFVLLSVQIAGNIMILVHAVSMSREDERETERIEAELCSWKEKTQKLETEIDEFKREHFSSVNNEDAENVINKTVIQQGLKLIELKTLKRGSVRSGNSKRFSLTCTGRFCQIWAFLRKQILLDDMRILKVHIHARSRPADALRLSVLLEYSNHEEDDR